MDKNRELLDLREDFYWHKGQFRMALLAGVLAVMALILIMHGLDRGIRSQVDEQAARIEELETQMAIFQMNAVPSATVPSQTPAPSELSATMEPTTVPMAPMQAPTATPDSNYMSSTMKVRPDEQTVLFQFGFNGTTVEFTGPYNNQAGDEDVFWLTTWKDPGNGSSSFLTFTEPGQILWSQDATYAVGWCGTWHIDVDGDNIMEEFPNFVLIMGPDWGCPENN